MAPKRKRKIHYEVYFLTVKDVSASHHSGLNDEAVDAANSFHANVPVYNHYSSLVFECECFYPDTHEGLSFHITVDARDEGQSLTLDDCAVLDDHNHPKMIERRGAFMPVHRLPDGIGYMEKVRGKNEWRAYCFVSSAAILSMTNILSLGKQCYGGVIRNYEKRYFVLSAVIIRT